MDGPEAMFARFQLPTRRSTERRSLLGTAVERSRLRASQSDLFCLWVAVFSTLFSSCAIGPKTETSPPFSVASVVVPARTVCNYLVIDVPIPRYGTAHFLVDTGSSITVITPGVAEKIALKQSSPFSRLQVRSASGDYVSLNSVPVTDLTIGGMRFNNIHAAVRDCSDLSTHLGLRIDGILGFSLFKDVVLTLDYPHSRITLSNADLPRVTTGTTIVFNNDKNIPIIPARIGHESFSLLVDSGSDAALSVNPHGLHLRYSHAPRPGPMVATLTGDKNPLVGRGSDPLLIGEIRIVTPLLQLTDDLSSVGGEVLKHFCVTFDQRRNQMTFDPVCEESAPCSCRSSGISFARNSTSWSVESIVPGSPAASLGIKPGDVCTEINNEPIPQWDASRFKKLVESSPAITFTIASGQNARSINIPVFELVPVN